MALVLEILIFLKNKSAYKNSTDRNTGVMGENNAHLMVGQHIVCLGSLLYLRSN